MYQASKKREERAPIEAFMVKKPVIGILVGIEVFEYKLFQDATGYAEAWLQL